MFDTFLELKSREKSHVVFRSLVVKKQRKKNIIISKSEIHEKIHKNTHEKSN